MNAFKKNRVWPRHAQLYNADSKMIGGDYSAIYFLETVIPSYVPDYNRETHKLTLGFKDTKSFITGSQKNCGEHLLRKIAFL